MGEFSPPQVFARQRPPYIKVVEVALCHDHSTLCLPCVETCFQPHATARESGVKISGS